MYRVVGFLVRWFLGIFNKVKVYGRNNLPNDGGYVLACTHSGWIDMLNLGISIYPKPIHFMAKKQLFDQKALGWFITKMHAFPVDRDNPGPSVVKVPMKLIKDGEIVGIFPSGTRNAEASNLKQGAITIAQLSKAPIIPAAYIGPNTPKEVFSKKKGYIIYGEPIYVNAKGKEGREAYTQLLEQQLGELLTQLQDNIRQDSK